MYNNMTKSYFFFSVVSSGLDVVVFNGYKQKNQVCIGLSFCKSDGWTSCHHMAVLFFASCDGRSTLIYYLLRETIPQGTNTQLQEKVQQK